MNQLTDLTRFIRDVRAEANRVTWPSWSDTRRLTLMVFILAALVAVYLTVVDLGIGALLSFVFGLKF